MTISTDAVLQAALVSAATQNNPFLAHLQLASAAGASTLAGTELEPAANAVSRATNKFWSATPNGSSVARISFDLGAATSVSFVGIAAHNLADIGATVSLQYSSDGSTWNSAPAGSVTPSDNMAIGFRMVAVSARYFRVSVTNASGDVVIGVVLLSRELLIERTFYQGYPPPLTPTRVELLTSRTEGGHFLGTSAIERGSDVSPVISNLRPEFLRGATWLEFQRSFNRGESLFWAWRPTKYPGDLFYARRPAGAGALVPTNSGPRELMSVELQMELYHE